MKLNLIALAVALVVGVPVHATDLIGTREPLAKDAVYFVMTDRFVNGDKSNDQRDQGGKDLHTFDRPIPGGPKGESDNIGYLGGDFKGVLSQADYIRGMGFGAVWITPIVDNPDEAFTGGAPVQWKGFMQDGGKTGYHGYWGDNFYKVDEHLPSRNLNFRQFTSGMRAKGLLTVLDIVCNHGSPAYTAKIDQPKFGKIYNKDGVLLADEQNLPPEQLNSNNPLHKFYHNYPDIAQLSNMNENNPAVLDYFVGAYLQWIDQGAAAFRVDTIRQMPTTFWKAFADRIHAKHPGFFMFGEAFDYDANAIAGFTWDRNGGYSVLDFPMKQAIGDAFGRNNLGYETLEKSLYLTQGPYANPYDLMTFYDNHDMARLDATDAGFINANNWLFTVRGTPVIYYGSEMGFERGKAEHEGNRNYYGVDNIAKARKSPIYAAMRQIALVRKATPALQRGLQFDVALKGETAAFYRVLDDAKLGRQVALVGLNKGAAVHAVTIPAAQAEPGKYRSSVTGRYLVVTKNRDASFEVPANGVEVWVKEGRLQNASLSQALASAMTTKGHQGTTPGKTANNQ